MYNYPYPMINGNNNGWGSFIILFCVIFLIITVFVVLRLLKHNELGSNHKVDALDVVKERYAKGAINKDEYEQLIKDLK